MKLSDQEKQLLEWLKNSTDRSGPSCDGWLRPMDLGGYNGSFHSRALAKFCRLGLAERKRRCVSIMGALGSHRAGYVYRFKR